MRLGERPRVLATGGIPVAGDVFDQKLVRAKLPRHFGEGSLYGPRHKALTTPQWIYDSFQRLAGHPGTEQRPKPANPARHRPDGAAQATRSRRCWPWSPATTA
jgi:hypothetical protein